MAVATVLVATGCSDGSRPSAEPSVADRTSVSLAPVSTTTTEAGAASTAAGSIEAGAGPAARTTDTNATPATTRAASTAATTTTTTTPPGRLATSGAREGCRTDARSGGNVQLSEDNQGGVGWEEFSSCSYAATVDGGYEARGSWRIEIVRNGTQLAIDSGDAPPCGSVGAIQAGDEVRAILRKGANSPEDWFVAVGPEQGC